MHALYEAGNGPTEIVKLCEAGDAGVPACDVKRKSAEAIVKGMAAEAAQEIPTTLQDAESQEAVEGFPVRIAAIVDAEIKRLERKQEQRGLSADDFERLKRAAGLSSRLSRRPLPKPQGSKGSGQPRKPRSNESTLERLTREDREEAARHEEGDAQLLDARKRQIAEPDAMTPEQGKASPSPTPAPSFAPGCVPTKPEPSPRVHTNPVQPAAKRQGAAQALQAIDLAPPERPTAAPRSSPTRSGWRNGER